MRVTTTLLLFLSLLQNIHTHPVDQPASQPQKREEQKDQKPLTPKYFVEPNDGDLVHYDARFFKHKVEGEEHTITLRNLIRSYLSTFQTIGIETWIAHGTLLGWWWNKKALPWDNDLDVQMAASSLEVLARGYNCTTHVFRYRAGVDENGEMVANNYLLDINPHHSEIRNDGQNVIDARWVDMSNGMYVDITGLADREKGEGKWSCRNHDYDYADFFPLIETEFEGVPALVPRGYEHILTQEYSENSMKNVDFEDNRWYPDVKEWRRIPEDEIRARRQIEKERREKEEREKKEREERERAERGSNKVVKTKSSNNNNSSGVYSPTTKKGCKRVPDGSRASTEEQHRRQFICPA